MSSLSASAENVSVVGLSGRGSGYTGCSADTPDNGGSSMCLELALEGERLCKSGDCRAGVAFFQAAIQAGTDDLCTLSAIYSQLGNAYFYLGDYSRAMQYHKLDLTLARSMNDKLGEAKSSGNLGNTLKVIGRFDEAVICCERHLLLARQLGDKLSEGRALYNLGNVYHAKGKHLTQNNPGDIGNNVKESLTKAVEYYQENLKLMRDLGDRSAQGRAYGNLGNTYYLLGKNNISIFFKKIIIFFEFIGDYQAAIEYHQERLRIAREFGDKAAERRANSNLGNSLIFLGQFEEAAEHYKRIVTLAMELGEREVEAQYCYCLGNTYTLLRDFATAIEYHQRHLAIAQELRDHVGEARACWSLGNAHSAIGNLEKALQYAQAHLQLAKELKDSVGENTARINIADLCKLLNLPDTTSMGAEGIEVSPISSDSGANNLSSVDAENSQGRLVRVRRQSMEQLDLIKITPDGKERKTNHTKQSNVKLKSVQEDDFFELLSRSQSKRMDDQRCSINVNKNSSEAAPIRKPLQQHNSLNIETTTTVVPSDSMLNPKLEGSSKTANTSLKRSTSTSEQPDDTFLDMLMRCQGSRLEEQRSELPKPNVLIESTSQVQSSSSSNITNDEKSTSDSGAITDDCNTVNNCGATVPDEDFFSLIMKVQSGRMEDQRATIPPPIRRDPTTNMESSTK